LMFYELLIKGYAAIYAVKVSTPLMGLG